MCLFIVLQLTAMVALSHTRAIAYLLLLPRIVCDVKTHPPSVIYYTHVCMCISVSMHR